MGSGFPLLSHPPWRMATGSKRGTAFDAQWKEAAWTIVRTFRAATSVQGRGPVFLPARIRNTDGYVSAG